MLLFGHLYPHCLPPINFPTEYWYIMANTNSEADVQGSPNGNAPITSSNGHSLLTLPVELVELIFEQVEPLDILSLRRVSRNTGQRVLKRFLEHFFSKRAFLLSSEDSLRALLSISENETLARGLKIVDLCVEDILNPEFAVEDLRDLNQPTSRGRSLTNKQGMKSGWHMREWHAAYEKQVDDRAQHVDLHLLTIIFSRIRRLGHSIEVRIVDQHEACESPLGKENLEWLCGERFYTENSSYLPVPMVLEAIALSAMPLEAFVVRYRDWDSRLECFSRTPREASNTRDAFRNLKKLHLLNDRPVPTLPRKDGMEAAFHALASASMVEDLSLQVRTSKAYRTGTYNDAILCLCDYLEHNFPLLKALDLQGYDLTLKQLENIVTHHPQLERLHFHGGEELHSPYPNSGFREYPPIEVDGYAPGSVLEDLSQVAGFQGKKIAHCTVFELKMGKDAFDEDFRESGRWGEYTWYVD